MDRNSRRNRKIGILNNNVYLIIGAIIIAIITFIIAYTLYNNTINKRAKSSIDMGKLADNKNEIVLNTIDNTSSEVSKSIGKSIEQVENSTVNKENIEKIAVNTSKEENNTKDKKVETNIEEDKVDNNGSNNEVKNENNIKDNNINIEIPNFTKPVDGDIIKNYSSDTLVYSETLEEWTTHFGIDYKAEKTSIVKATADGTIKSIKTDPRYGLTVVIEHANGFTSMYANLLSTEFITVGESVKQGQTIATVGNTATFEIADETHLHFEILKDGVNVDPNLYLK